MKNRKKILAVCLLFTMTFISVSGCSCSNKENTDNVTSNSTAGESEVFGNYSPVLGEITYLDSDEKIIDNKKVFDNYEQPATHQGKLQYEDYNTYDYDEDNHPMEKYLVVYTPYGYDNNKEYDIMYLTHGHTGGATTWLGSPTDPYEMKNVLDHLIEDGKVRPMIVVSMTYYDDNKDEETSDYDSQILNSFGKELRNDIIPMVESKYSTYAKSLDLEGFKASRDHRIMGGFSMGGVTTCLQICESMDYFRYYMPVSGTLYWSTAGRSSSSNPGKRMEEAIKAQGYTKDDFYIYMSTGTVDFAKSTMDRQFDSIKACTDMFTVGKPGEAGVNCSYGVGTGEGHNSHGRETATFNALPAISSLIGKSEVNNI